MTESAAINKKAFDEIIGDPFAIPEPIDGFYNSFRRRSSMGAQQYNFDEGHATRNPAQPSQLDFLCDVEHVLTTEIKNTKLLRRIEVTYMECDLDSDDALSQQERAVIEQYVGKMFRQYKVSPVSNYFRTIRDKR